MAEVEPRKDKLFDPSKSNEDEVSSAALTPQSSIAPSESRGASESTIQLENSQATTDSSAAELTSTEFLPDTVVIPTAEPTSTQPTLEPVTLPPDTTRLTPSPLSPAKEAVLTRLVEVFFPTRITRPPAATVPPIRSSGVEASPPIPSTVISVPSPVVNPSGQRGMTSPSPKAERANTLKALIIPAMLVVALGGALLAFASQRDWLSLPGFERQAVDPMKVNTLLKEGAEDLRRGEYDQAIARYDEAIRLTSKDYQLYVGRGLARHRLGRLREAEADYDRAIALLKDPKPSTAGTSTASKNLNAILAQTYNNRSHVRYDRGNFTGAEEDASEAIRLNQTLAVAYINRANARSKSNNKEGAMQDYGQAIKISRDPRLLAGAYTNLGNLHSASGDFQSAIQNHIQALRVQRDYADASYNLALVYQSLGRQQIALAQMRQAVILYRQQGNSEMQERATNIVNNLVNSLEQNVQSPGQPTNPTRS